MFSRSIRGSTALVSRMRLSWQHDWHNGCVNTISFTQSGKWLISGSDDQHIVMGDWQTGSIRHRWHSGHQNNVFQAKTMPFSNERVLVSCAADGQVRVSELKDDGEVCSRALVQHSGRAHKLAIDPNSPHLVLSTGEDGYVHMLDIRAGQSAAELVRVQKPSSRRGGYGVVGQNSIALNPANPNYFCTGGDDPICRVWDRRKLPHTSVCPDGMGLPVYQLGPRHLLRDRGYPVSITCAVYSHDGAQIVASYNDELIYLLDASNPVSPPSPFLDHGDTSPHARAHTLSHASGRLYTRGGAGSGDASGRGYLQRYQGHRNRRTVKGVNFMGPCSEFIVSGSDCGHVFVWDKYTEQVLIMLKGDNEVRSPRPAPTLSHKRTRTPLRSRARERVRGCANPELPRHKGRL